MLTCKPSSISFEPMLRNISLASLGLWVGLVITIVGFAAYFADYATLNLAGFFYGIPLLLIGLALKSAELKPVRWTKPTSDEVLNLRQQQATETQAQIRNDITRYRYGQEAHLSDALAYLGLSPTDQERPVLEGVREEAVGTAYALVLEFESSLIAFETWQDKLEKMEKFFGPGVRVELSQPDEDYVDVALIATPTVTPVTMQSDG
jgi:Protein of unknown function (DUF2854)